MSKLLEKKRAQAQKTKPANNLIDIKKDIISEEQSNQKKQPENIKKPILQQDDGWGDEETQPPIIVADVPKQAQEEQPSEKINVAQIQEKVTWADVVEAPDEQPQQVQQSQQEQTQDKKASRISWVPQQLREKEQKQEFVANDEDFVGLNDANIVETKKQKKEEKQQKDEQKQEQKPRFINGNKGGFKPLEQDEQTKKMIELQEKLQKTYITTEKKPFEPQQEEKVQLQTLTQPPRFQNSKTAEQGGNFVQIQKTELELKQEEIQKRSLQKLQEQKAQALQKENEKEQPKETVQPVQDEKNKPVLKFFNSKKQTNETNFVQIETVEEKAKRTQDNEQQQQNDEENDDGFIVVENKDLVKKEKKHVNKQNKKDFKNEDKVKN